MANSPSAATLFYQFLEAAEEELMITPRGTKYIIVDLDLCGYLAEDILGEEGMPLDLRVVLKAFLGVPVKQAFGVVTGSMSKIHELPERDRFLRNYARKRAERKCA